MRPQYGLPLYLIDELERILTRSLKIIGLPADSPQSLEQRRDYLPIREYKKIINDETHPKKSYILEITGTPRTLPQFLSHTERHERSLFPEQIHS